MTAPAKVLVVADDPALAAALAQIAADGGCETARAASIPEARGPVFEGLCDVVLLSSGLPGAGAFCEAVKTHDRARHVQILVITASATREGAAREFRIWADEFVPLPVDGSDLLRRIRAQVRVKQCQESLTRRGGNADAPWPPEPCTDPGNPARALPAAHVRTIAHELNQPLTSIMGYAEMLKRRLPGGSAEHRYADTIFSEAERLAAIVKQLGRLARGEPPGKEGDGTP